MKIALTGNTKKSRALIRYLKFALNRENTNAVLHKEAEKSRLKLISKTPRRWSGLTKARWVTKPLPNGWLVTNTNTPVILFLERGTKAHGPKRARALYIPLTSKGHFQYGLGNRNLKYGKDYILRSRVRGIKALKLVQKERPLAKARLRRAMKSYIRRAIVQFNTSYGNR